MYFTCPGGSGRVQLLTKLTPRVGPLPKNLRPSASDAWEAPLYVFYVSWKLWEAHLYVFTCLGGSWGGQIPRP